MPKNDIELEIKSLRERITVLEKQLQQIDDEPNENKPKERISGWDGIGGNHGGGRTARPDRGKPYRW